MGRYEEAIAYFAQRAVRVNERLISWLVIDSFEAVETGEVYPETVTIIGPDGYRREFDAESLVEALEKVGSTDEVYEILGWDRKKWKPA